MRRRYEGNIDLGDLLQRWASADNRRSTRFVVTGIVVVFLLMRSFIIVGAGERAVIFSRISGVKPGQLDEGLHLNIPIVWVPVKYDIRTQTYTMSGTSSEGQVKGDDSLNALTSDGLPVNLELSVRFHLDPENVWKLHREIGREYTDKVVRQEARSDTRMIVSEFPVIDVYSGRRQMIVDRIKERLTRKFSKSYMVLDELLLRDIKFSQEFQAAIEQKQVAQQETKRMDFVLQQARLERQRKIVEAQGDASAIRLKARALMSNPQLVQYEYMKRLPDKVQTIITDSKTIINMSDLFGKGETK
ncbi:MAG: prohibitin family protein [Armatimonadetes bacterium]|nr:prohibitin family protein [Armatimonadota bacterium]